MAEPLQLMVRTRERVVFEGEVKSVTATNQKGAFDVLPLHGNFISLLGDKITIRQVDGSKQELAVPDGVVRVVKNKIEIYVGVKLLTGK